MLVFGSSLVVYPAAELPMIALSQGAALVIVNLEATTYDAMATVNVRAKLGEFAKTALAAFL
jgi:NAD-dependent deacetylase